MSRDDGIYILHTKDNQYRVSHAQAIENIYDDSGKRYDPFEVVRTWCDCRYTRDRAKAYEIASKMDIYWHNTEYGIKEYEYSKTWKHLLEDAKNIARNKLNEIENLEENSWNDYIKEVCANILEL